MAAARPQPGGQDAELFHEEIFGELRAAAGVPVDFLNDGWSLDKLASGGGKGGTLMARLGTEYIVKELSPGDHNTLLDITASYGEHARGGPTLLSPIYAHFRDLTTGRFFFAMRNGVGDGPFTRLYDLKGCADDKMLEKDGKPIKAVHKRIWNVRMWVGKLFWSDDRKEYYNGKVTARGISLLMTEAQKAIFIECMRRDTEWLEELNLMDYSLLIAYKSPAAGGDSSPSQPSGTCTESQLMMPMLGLDESGAEIALYVSIIDFLQRYTTGKKVAHWIKCAEKGKATVCPRAYAARFRRHFEIRARPNLVPLPSRTTTSEDNPREGAPPAATPTAPPPAERREDLDLVAAMERATRSVEAERDLEVKTSTEAGPSAT